jgi:hypothetical protein
MNLTNSATEDVFMRGTSKFAWIGVQQHETPSSNYEKTTRKPEKKDKTETEKRQHTRNHHKSQDNRTTVIS